MGLFRGGLHRRIKRRVDLKSATEQCVVALLCVAAEGRARQQHVLGLLDEVGTRLGSLRRRQARLGMGLTSIASASTLVRRPIATRRSSD